MSKARELAALGNAYSDGALSNRNLIINGAMQVAQRGTSSTTQGFSTVDRFFATSDATMTAAVITQSQASDGPDGFVNSYKVSVDTSETVANVDYFYISQCIEAQNLQHLGFGTSGAKRLTLSFWVKSSVTGTYTASIFRHDAQRIFPKTYQVETADTWEYKTIVMDGDTTGTIANDNGRGINIYWVLSAGSDYTNGGTDNTWQAYTGSVFANDHSADIVGTTGATFFITGVQLEVGDTATPFEHRSYGDELARCQRYYEIVGDSGVQFGVPVYPTNGLLYPVAHRGFQVEKRAAPTLANIDLRYFNNGWNTSTPVLYSASVNGCLVSPHNITTSVQYLMDGSFSADAEL